MSIQDLRPDPQDTSAFYLANIYHLYSNTNETSIPSTPPPFSPPRYAVWVNSLWFMSLVISLTCALLATSLQQWTRRYIKNAQPKRCPPQEQARKRAFFADGMDEMPIPLPRAVEGMPALLHLSVFLFFAGLLIFLFNINSTVFIPVTSWIAFFLLVYVCITLMPIVRPSSPYHAPFSPLACFLCARLAFLYFLCLTSIAYRAHRYDAHSKFRKFKDRYRYWRSGGHRKVVQKEILEMSSKIDLRILDWTLHALGGDGSLETFFQSIPGFLGSDLAKNLRKDFSFDLATTFMETLYGFMNRTLSSNSISKKDKARRLKIYKDVMNVIPGPTIPSEFLDQAVKNGQIKAPQPIETGQTLAMWLENTEEKMSDYVQETLVRVLSSVSVQERDVRWETLAIQQFNLLGPNRTDLHRHVNSPNDDALLYLLNHVISEATLADSLSASLTSILSTLSNLATPGINPDLRREFCRLWNTNIDKASDPGANRTPIEILRRIHRLFFALHQATNVEPTGFTADTGDDEPQMLQLSSYGKCTLPDHVDP